MVSGTLDAITMHLAAASSSPPDVALLHLAQARVLLVGLEEATANARRGLEAMEREMPRRAAAIVIGTKTA